MEIANRSKNDEIGENKAVKFQIQLITMVLLNAFKKLHSWRLLAEKDQAAGMDYVVLQWSEGSIFLQAKHSQTRYITFNDLFSNNDFSIPTNFLRYQRLKEKYQTVNIVICTNAGIKIDERNKEFLNSQPVGQDSVLYCHGNARFYTFNKTIVPDLKKRINSVCSGEVVVRDDVQDFLEHVQFSCDYPSENELHGVIEQFLYGKEPVSFHKKPQGVLDKVAKWIKKLKVGDCEYLTEIQASAIFCQMRSQKLCDNLNQYGVSFVNNKEFDFHKTKNIYHVISEKGYLLETIKIFRSLELRKTTALYVNPDDDIDMKRVTIEAFGLLDYPVLVIIWPELTQETQLKDISAKLRDILRRHSYKKIFLVGEKDNKLIHKVEPNTANIVTIRNPVAFEDLTEDSRRKILNKKLIDFQGCLTSLKDLMGERTIQYYGRAMDAEILEKLVKGVEVKVGSIARHLDEEIERYYIPRKLTREIEEEETWEEIYSEEDIFQVSDKFVIIENRGGMGKTTLLTNLAAIIKNNYPLKWVIRIEFHKYKDILKDLMRRDREVLDITELLNFHNSTKLNTKYEQFVFSLEDKVVLMLDAVDEISDDVDPCMGLILSLFEQCQNASNIAKVFVASREHAIQRLIEYLQVTPFKLLPFERPDYVNFFLKFWTAKLSVSGRDVSKCQKYVEAVVDKMGLWIDPDYNSAEILDVVPLLLKMIAEIFQESSRFGTSEEWEGCKEFLRGESSRPNLPKKIKNIADLFSRFIEKKRDEASSSQIDSEMTLKKYKEYVDHRKLM